MAKFVSGIRWAGMHALLWVWNTIGLRRAVFTYMVNKDLKGRGHTHFEDVTLSDHPIVTLPQSSTDAYLNYLKLPQGTVQRPVGVTRLTKARLSYPSGVVDGAEGVVLDTYPNRSVINNPKYAKSQLGLRLPGVTSHHEKAALLYTAWCHNFFHWTLDIVPRFGYAAMQDPSLPLVMFDGAPKFARESLALLAPDRDVLWLGAGRHSFDVLHVPANLAGPALVSSTALAFLQNTYFPILQSSLPERAHDRPKRLYISRRDAGSRRIVNEARIEEALKELGFVSIIMSEHSLAAQADLFSHADIVVGSHGAAFANLAFAKRGAAVIEIFRDGHRSRSFYSIAERLGLEYGFMIGTPTGADTEVDLEILLALIDNMRR